MSKDQRDNDLARPAFKQVIVFESIHGPRKALSHPCFYDLLAFRSPKKNEHFLDGPTLDRAALAVRDFPEGSEYWIVEATNFAARTWAKGARV